MVINEVSSDVRKAIEVLLFCADNEEFPKPSGQEFSISQKDIDLFDKESLEKLEKSISDFLEESGIENVEEYEEVSGRSVVADGVYTGVGSGVTFEHTPAYEHLRMCAKKHLGWLEFAGPYKGDDGKIYL